MTTTDTPNGWLKQELPEGYAGTRRLDDDPTEPPLSDACPQGAHCKTQAELKDAVLRAREWKKKYRDLDRSVRCEYCDPNGTIWECCTKRQVEQENSRLKVEADFNRLNTLMHQAIWFVDDMIKTHTNGCEHCLKKQGALIALFKDITEGPQWPEDSTK